LALRAAVTNSNLTLALRMNHILLLGAGFSRNWGGWLGEEVFEYLLGCPEVASDSDLQRRLWQSKDRGGFEAALEELQDEATHKRDQRQLEGLEKAIHRMFSDMDAGFRNHHGNHFEFEFSNGTSLVKDFLSRFDAIFTLNQDLLLERHYFQPGFGLGAARRWTSYSLPGMKPAPNPQAACAGELSVPDYVPSGNFGVSTMEQPYYKLHGSSNWRDADGRLIIALGGNKAGTIQKHTVLRHSMQQFETMLLECDCRLAIIGYGFLDQHINKTLSDAAKAGRGLKIFVIDPLGVEVMRGPLERRPFQIRGGHPFEGHIIGASRRGLAQIFGSDFVERQKVLRFFT